MAHNFNIGLIVRWAYILIGGCIGKTDRPCPRDSPTATTNGRIFLPTRAAFAYSASTAMRCPVVINPQRLRRAAVVAGRYSRYTVRQTRAHEILLWLDGCGQVGMEIRFFRAGTFRSRRKRPRPVGGVCGGTWDMIIIFVVFVFSLPPTSGRIITARRKHKKIRFRAT